MKRSIIIMTLLCAGCSSATETGNPHDEPGEPGLGGACKEAPHDIEMDETTSLGFSAQDVAAMIEGTHTETLEWLDGELASPSFDGSTQLEVRVEVGDSARFVQSERASGGQEGLLAGLGGDCNDRLELDATVFITSADGALDERVEAVFRAESTRLASSSFSVSTDEVSGQLEVTLNPPSGFEPEGPANLTFDVGIADVGFAGRIGVTATYSDGGSLAAGGGGPIARWPADNPCELGFPVPTDQSDASQRVLDGFNAPEPLELSYEPEMDGSALRLALNANATVCETLTGGAETTREVRFQAELALESDDGVIDGVFPVEVYGQVKADGELVSQASMSTTSENTADWLESLGIHHTVDFSAHDHGQVALTAEIYAGELTGALSVRGADVPDCLNSPPEPDSSGMGAPGCAGIDYVDLWVARFKP